VSSAEAEGTAPDAPGATERGGWRRALRQELPLWAELAALVGFAVVQPVLGPFGESPETFVAAGAGPADIVLFAALVCVVPLVVLALVAAATRRFGERVRFHTQTVLVGLLAAFAATYVVRRVDAGGAVRTAVALAVAALAVVVYRRWEGGRLFLRFAAPTPALLAVVFLLASPVAPLVRPEASSSVAEANGSHPPVLFIVLDELPTLSIVDGDGQVDRELFPNLARLADTATWYRNHTAVATQTAVSLPAITTGQFPRVGPERPAVHSQYPDNLFTLLAPTHEVHAVEWVTDLCPADICPDRDVELTDEAQGLLRARPEVRGALSTLVDEAGSLWWGQVWPPGTPPSHDNAQAGVTEVNELALPGLQFLSGLDEPTGDRPTFDYLHVPVPHQPWRLLPSGGSYDGPHPAFGAEFLAWGPDDTAEQLALAAKSRHVLQMQWTDRMLGEIFDRVEELGRWDESLIVLTADHGVSFSPGVALRHGQPENQVEVFWTPLFVKLPNQTEAEVVDDNVLAVDVVPTVADVVGVEADWDLHGTSLVGGGRDDDVKPAHSVEADLFDRHRDDGLVLLDADGLARIRDSGTPAPPGDELRPWRYGRHGDLLGREVDELGECGRGPAVDYEPPEGWDDYLRGELDRSTSLPVWHEATVDADGPLDVAAVLDGRVVSWGVARPDEGGGAKVGLLLTEPLIDGAAGTPRLYQVNDTADGCALTPLRG